MDTLEKLQAGALIFCLIISPIMVIYGLITRGEVNIIFYIFTVLDVALVLHFLIQYTIKKLCKGEIKGDRAYELKILFYLLAAMFLLIGSPALYLSTGMCPKDTGRKSTSSNFNYNSYSRSHRHQVNTYETSEPLPSPSSSSSSSSTSDSTSRQNEDGYDMDNYANAEDFYDENYDNFECYDDAETYYNNNTYQ